MVCLQGDMMLAESLVQLLGTKLVACFIHQVVPLSETATRERKGQVQVAEEVAAGWPKLWREQKIFLGSDYISLAAEVWLATFGPSLCRLSGLHTACMESLGLAGSSPSFKHCNRVCHL